MKYLLSFYYWTISILYFLIFCFLGFVLTFFIPNERLDPLLKKGCRILFKLLNIKVEVEGLEHINPEKAYIFMANHVSGFDLPLLEGYIPGFARGVEAKHHFNIPVFGWLIRRIGNIPIDRKNIHTSIRSIGSAKNRLSQNRSIIILPEGHRTLDGNLMPFKKLPFIMAKRAEVDIIPMGLSGLFYLNRKGSFLIRPTTLKVKFGEPIPLEQIKRLSVDDLKVLTRLAIEGLVEYP